MEKARHLLGQRHLSLAGVSIWLLLVGLFSIGTPVGDTGLALLSVAYVVFSVGLLAATIRQERTVFNPFALFQFSMLAFNAGQVIVYVVSAFDKTILPQLSIYNLPVETTAAVIAISGYYTAAFYVGAQFVSSCPNNSNNKVVDDRTVLLIATVASLIIAPFWLAKLASDAQKVAQYGYFALYRPYDLKTADISTTLAGLFVPFALFWFVLERGRSRYLPFAALLLGSVMSLALGNRGWGLLTLISTLWAYDRSVSKINRPALAIGSVLAFLILPLIALVRNTPLANLSTSDIALAIEHLETPFAALLNETGGSAMALGWTLDLVRASEPLQLGKSYLLSLTTMFPNLFFSVHPAVANSLDHWLVWKINPAFAAAGGGYGYSQFAEHYINFGMVGGGVASAAVGYVVQFVSRVGMKRKSSSLEVGICAVAMSFMLFCPRQDSSIIFRPVIWTILGPLFLAWLVGRSRSRNAAATSWRWIKVK